MSDEPVQHSWPHLTCYGCNPANEAGLQLKSYLGSDGETTATGEVLAVWVGPL